MYDPLFLVRRRWLYGLSFECSPSLMNFSFIRDVYFLSEMEENDYLGICFSYKDSNKRKKE